MHRNRSVGRDTIPPSSTPASASAAAMSGTGTFGGGGPSSRGGGTLKKGQNPMARAAAAKLQRVMASTGGSSPEDEDDDGPFSGYSGGLPIFRSNSPVVRTSSSTSTPKYPRISTPTGMAPGASANSSGIRTGGARTLNPMEVRIPERPAAAANAALDSKRTDRRFSADPPINSTTMAARRDTPAVRDDASITSLGSGDDGNGGRERASSTSSYMRRDTTAALHDEIDLLHEENEFLMEKLRIAEEKLDASEERNAELRRQIASLGEGFTVEARMLSRKEAALRMREEALKVAKEQASSMKEDEIAALRLEAESAREDANTALQEKHEAEAELKALRVAVQRMALTQEEMEEVVLKRCWLARHWGLAKGLGP